MRSRLLIAALACGVLTGGAACGPMHSGAPRTSVGQTTVIVTVRATARNGAAASPAELSQSGQILTRRLTAAGFTRVQVAPAADGLTVAVAGPLDADRQHDLRVLLAESSLAVREVLGTVPEQQVTNERVSVQWGAPIGDTANLAQVKAKLGQAYGLAQAYVASVEQGSTVVVSDADPLKAFTALVPEEIAALPAEMQFYVPWVTCAQLDNRQSGTNDDPASVVVACGSGPDGQTKYVLGPTLVDSSVIASAKAGPDDSGGFQVTLTFTGPGQPKWTDATRQVYNDGLSTGQGSSIAFALDEQVLTAPIVSAVITGDAVIAGGGMTEQTTKLLAVQLNFGSLPVAAAVVSMQTQTSIS